MRIRPFRPQDMQTIVEIEAAAASADGRAVWDVATLAEGDPLDEYATRIFVVTDDDDELHTWSQAGTLEGIEGEMIGYTLVRHDSDAMGYYVRCIGAVLPQQRRRGTGRLLLVGALNYARLLAEEMMVESQRAGLPIYFEVLLPAHDPGSALLATRFELTPVEGEEPSEGLRRFRCEL